MNTRNLIIRVCIYNFLAYALVFTGLVSWPKVAELRHDLSSGSEREANEFQVLADTSGLLTGDALLDALRAGGNVLYVRHYETARSGITDDLYKPQHAHLPLGIFDDCSWQRPLSDGGVAAATAVGRVIERFAIPVGTVYASPYCRTIESAVAMFGRTPEIDRKLIFRTQSYSISDANRHVFENYLTVAPAAGVNVVVVAHRPPMDALGGIEEGETMIFRPGHDGLRLIARVPAMNWIGADLEIAKLGDPNEKDSRKRETMGRWASPPKASYPPVEELISIEMSGG